MPPRPPSIRAALARSLKARPLEPWEEPTAALARRLALELDMATDPQDVARLSGRLTAVLERLGMTRSLRPPTPREEPDRGGTVTALDAIRAERARQRDPQAVDPPAT
jgi:hypothetical protein